MEFTEGLDYIDFDNSELLFTINEGKNNIGEIEACLAPNKAGLQIVRFRTKIEELNKKEEILKNIINYIWNYNNMNNLVLAIHINYEGSGFDYSNLEHLGFVGVSSYGAQLYTLLNPNYVNLIEKYAENQEALENLFKYYNSYSKRQKSQLNRIKKNLERVKQILKDEENYNLENERNYYEECIKSIEDSERKSL